jgi:hypothetical protein
MHQNGPKKQKKLDREESSRKKKNIRKNPFTTSKIKNERRENKSKKESQKRGREECGEALGTIQGKGEDPKRKKKK